MPLRAGCIPDPLVLFLRFGSRQGDHGLHTVDSLHAVRFAMEARDEPGVEVVGIFPHPLDIGMHGEDGLGVLGREITAAVGGTGLP